jgi:hypothetical protein
MYFFNYQNSDFISVCHQYVFEVGEEWAVCVCLIVEGAKYETSWAAAALSSSLCALLYCSCSTAAASRT